MINRVNILLIAIFTWFSSVAFGQVDQSSDTTINDIGNDDFVEMDSSKTEISFSDTISNENPDDVINPKVNSPDEENDEFIFKPQVSIGTGMLTFYGDIGTNHKGYHPMVSRLATTLRLINPLTDYLDVGFYVMFGEISANERTVGRNLNFNSNITTGGITLNYNFDHFLKKDRIADPYIHVGLESIEICLKMTLMQAMLLS